jgi:hypothetical protein
VPTESAVQPPTARRPSSAAPARRAAGRAASASAWARRWWKVALLVVLVLLGLPLAHALLGEVVALLGGAVLFGFLLGRWTAPSLR